MEYACTIHTYPSLFGSDETSTSIHKVEQSKQWGIIPKVALAYLLLYQNSSCYLTARSIGNASNYTSKNCIKGLALLIITDPETSIWSLEQEYSSGCITKDIFIHLLTSTCWRVIIPFPICHTCKKGVSNHCKSIFTRELSHRSYSVLNPLNISNIAIVWWE